MDKTVQVRVCALFIGILVQKNKKGFFRKEYEGGGGDWDEKVIYGRTAHHERAVVETIERRKSRREAAGLRIRGWHVVGQKQPWRVVIRYRHSVHF